MIEEYVKRSREIQQNKFGFIETKTDCKYYEEDLQKKGDCRILVKTKDTNRLQCECAVCHFYERKNGEIDGR